MKTILQLTSKTAALGFLKLLHRPFVSTKICTANEAAVAQEEEEEEALEKNGMQLGCLISVNASDVSTAKVGDWVMIAPFGVHPSPDGTYVQKFDRAQSDKVVSTHNSIAGKAVRFFKNIRHGLGAGFTTPCWDGHPDSNKSRWPKEKLLFETDAVRTGNAGLEGRIATVNEKNMESRTPGPLYPSPLWWHNPPAGTPPTVYPELLESVGMVRTPNISSAPAWTQNALASNPEAQSTANTTNNIMNEEQLKALRKALNLPDNAEPGKIIETAQGATQLSTSNATALTTANSARTDLENQLRTANESLTGARNNVTTLTTENGRLATENGTLRTANESMVKAVLDGLEAAGCFTPADRTTTQTRFTANAGEVFKELLAKKPALNVKRIELNGNRVDITTQNARASAFTSEVKKYMTANSVDYDTAFAHCLTDPQLAGLTGAMKDPAKKAAEANA